MRNKVDRRHIFRLGVCAIFLAASSRHVSADIDTLALVRKEIEAKGTSMEKEIVQTKNHHERGDVLVAGLKNAVEPFVLRGDLTSVGMTVAGQSDDAITVYIWIGLPGGRHVDFVYEMLLEF